MQIKFKSNSNQMRYKKLEYAFSLLILICNERFQNGQYKNGLKWYVYFRIFTSMHCVHLPFTAYYEAKNHKETGIV